MSENNVFYVYEHWRPDTGQCFYVGKGKYPKRAIDLNNRSKWHRAITAKLKRLELCVDVRIVASELTENAAFDLERMRIAHWRSLGIKLVNFTDGGEGISGFKASDKTRARMRDVAILRAKNPEYREKLRIATTARWQSDGYRERLSKILSVALKGISRGPQSEEAKRKISLANKGRKHVPPSEETRRKIGDAHRGKERTEETKRKISVSNKGKRRTPEQIQRLLARPPLSAEARAKIGAVSRGNKYRLGSTHSDEVKERLRQLGFENIAIFKRYSHMGPMAIAKKVVCLDDGLLFESASVAARHYGAAKSAIIELCNGYKSRRKTVGGRVFKYAEVA